MSRVLFIENHDSFSWNVIDTLPFERSELTIVHAAEASLEGVDAVVMGPGPTDPVRAGLVTLVQEIARRGLPFLGICLGHQALGLAFGATLRRSTPAHGKRDVVHFSGAKRLVRADGPMTVMRYHSLSLTDVAAPLRTVGALVDGTVMALEHESLPMAGVQFHPDSFGTPEGRALVHAFFEPLFQREPRTRPSKRVRLADAAQGLSNRRVVPPARRLTLSQLQEETDFALLAPGYTGTEAWTLLSSLHKSDSGPLWFASAEGNPERFDGVVEPVELVFDVPPAEPTVIVDGPGYVSGVEAIRQRIGAGDVYQVNLTLRAQLEGAGVNGASLLCALSRRAVPRFAAWVKASALGEFVSASPELLFETKGRWIHAEPMKGTAGAGQRAVLEGSDKDRAELAMITDLLRDDVHQLCEPGSVEVTAERRFIELPYVVQSVADVEGLLREGVSLADVLEVIHPGGSISGAPRQAALEMIAALEATKRGAYCGALGFEGADASRFALLIRTAELISGAWRYGVGGGITWHSEPVAELNEIRLKLGVLGLSA